MRKLHICTRRLIAATLAIIMAMSLSVSALADEEEYYYCGDPRCPVCYPVSTTAPSSVDSFGDVPDTHAFHEAILWCAGQGIVNGYSGGVFLPANTVSRSNFTVMLSRAFYASDVAANSSYASQGTFMPNYMAMLNNGILNGTPFSNITALQNVQTMNRGINRYEMAQLMTNIMNAKGFAASSSEKAAVASKIPDLNDAPSYYQDAVKNVYALGIITGYADGSFNGAGIMNRGQAAVVIYRMMQKSGNGGGSTTPDPEAPVDPGTGEIACACVTLNGECKCCNTTGDTGNSGNTGTTKPETPETPSQPTTLTLRDGSTVTEANARKILETVMAAYPGKNWTENSSRNSNMQFNGNSLGTPSTAMTTVANNYYTYKNPSTHPSMTLACGGLASMASDAIFGGFNTGGTNFPARKLNSVADAKVGDIYVMLQDGLATHISVITSVGTMSAGPNGTTKRAITKYDGGGQGGNTDVSGYIFDGTLANGSSTEVWTRYPA